MGFLLCLGSWLTTFSGLAVAVGAAMEAAGLGGGAEIMAGATAFGLAMSKDGNREG